MISDGAPDGGRTSSRPPCARRRRCTSRSRRSSSGRRTGVVTAEARRRLHGADPRAAEPGDAAEDRAGTGGAFFQARTSSALAGRLPASRVACRAPHRGPRDHRPVRGRRDRAPARRRRRCPPSGSGGSRDEARRARRARDAAVLAVAAAPAGATNECRGLQVCVPITGPWVLASVGAEVQYQLPCPTPLRRRRARRRAQHPRHRRQLPRRTRQSGQSRDHDDDSRRLPRAARARHDRGGELPSARRLRSRIRRRPADPDLAARVPARQAAAAGDDGDPDPRGHAALRRDCAAGERLVSATHAIGFYTDTPPTRALAGSVAVTQSVSAGRLHVSVHAGPAAGEVRSVVQVDLVCVAGR